MDRIANDIMNARIHANQCEEYLADSLKKLSELPLPPEGLAIGTRALVILVAKLREDCAQLEAALIGIS